VAIGNVEEFFKETTTEEPIPEIFLEPTKMPSITKSVPLHQDFDNFPSLSSK